MRNNIDNQSDQPDSLVYEHVRPSWTPLSPCIADAYTFGIHKPNIEKRPGRSFA